MLQKTIFSFIFLSGVCVSGVWGQFTYEKITDSIDTTKGMYKFHITHVPKMDTFEYTAYWFFDDGGFSLDTAPLHTFRNTNPHNVTLELTYLDRVYEDDDHPPMASYSQSINPEVTGDAVDTVDMPEGSVIEVNYSRKPRIGDTITYIITIQKDSICPASDYFLTASFDTNVVDFIRYNNHGTSWIHSFSFSDRITLLMATPSIDTFQKNVFFEFAVKETVDTLQSPKFEASLSTLQPNFEGNCFDSKRNPQNVKPDLMAVKSHDPNFKIVFPGSVCRKTECPKKIQYYTQFKNIGNGPADSVKIYDWIDLIYGHRDSLNYTSWTYEREPGDSSLDRFNRRMYYYFDTIHPQGLRGDNEDGLGHNFPVHHTESYIGYKIDFPMDSFQSCNAILNSAKILFDTNAPIWTDLAITKFDCYKTDSNICKPCHDTALHLPTITIYEGETTDVKLPPELTKWLLDTVNQYTNFRWYPAYRVKNPYDPASVINYDTAEQKFLYSLIAFNPDTSVCKRIIIHQEIEYCPPISNSNSVPEEKYWWWIKIICTILLLPFLIFGSILWRKKKKEQKTAACQDDE